MLRIWITGGAGFIGSHLCQSWINQGHEVRCIDNLSSGTVENLKQGLLDHTRFKFVERDVCEPWPLPMGSLRRPDVVYHLASLASPVDYIRDPIGTIRANTEGVRHALDFVRAAKCRLVYASTSEVYGNPTQTPQVEELSGTLKPQSVRAPYYVAKGAGEALVYAYKKHHGVNALVGRIFNTFGPRMRREDGRCVPSFIDRALKNKPLLVHGDGRQTRSFCYVSDTVRALVRMGVVDSFDGPVNIGNDQETSIFTLARTIIRMLESKSDIHYCGRYEDDPNRRCPDLQKADKVLQWRPSVSLKQGLINTLLDDRDRYASTS